MQFEIQRRITGVRLDAYLAERFQGYSRTFFRDLIRRGKVLVNRLPTRASHKVGPGEQITLFLPRGATRDPFALDLDVIYEDRSIIVLNKPPGVVVHPARGHMHDSLLNALYHRYREEMEADEAFQVLTIHRLDIDTSGAIIYSTDAAVQYRIQQEFETRGVQKTYLAVVHGSPGWEETTVKAALGTDLEDRKKVSVDGWDSRPAHTDFQVLARGDFVTLVRAFLHTGRSHQIRVHLSHIGHPVAADEMYGGRQELGTGEHLIKRQALHSEKIQFFHPGLGKRMEVRAGLPEDMRRLLERKTGAGVLEQLHLDNGYRLM
ncbi:MAG: RluA family pseudouridine synthase [Planctomycetes bacterium]|nr:RluA family pseudouridine synthase [Planctomycetota bacterium]